MKKIVSLLLIGIVFTACQKEKQIAPVSNQQHNSVLKSRPIPEKIQVSDRGYLVIPDSNSYSDYIDFLYNSTEQQIQDYHSSIGFVNQTSNPDQANNNMPSDQVKGAYVFNEDGVVQIGSVLYRGVADDGFFLALPLSNLTDNTYNKLIAKEFDPNAMCRLKIGGDYGDDLGQFVSEHVGFDDPGTPPPPPEVCARKVTWYYTGGGVTIIDESWYFLGFRYRHNVTVIYP